MDKATLLKQKNENNLGRAVDAIRCADSLLITAGAGMGVDSGLPDFRGRHGFWKTYPALGKEKVDFYQIATPQSFKTKPTRAWGFYGLRMVQYRQTIPHAGFEILKRIGEAMPNGFSVFTSNVDGQFQAAGYKDEDIVECHGSLHKLQCSQVCNDAIWSAQNFEPQVDSETARLINAAPTCPNCGAIARPNVLLFDDSDFVEYDTQIKIARQRQWLQSVKQPVIIELGAGITIQTVRNFSQRIAKLNNGTLIRINPTDPNVERQQDVRLQMGALEGLQALENLLKSS